jgi:integrase
VKRADCERDKDVVHVCLNGKGDKKRHVRIPVGLLVEIDKAFQSRKGEREWLFQTNQEGRFSRQYVTREVRRAAKRILGRVIGAHVIRHARASDLYKRTGGDLKGTADLMGHASVATTARYYVRARLSDEDLFGEDGE